MVEFLHFDIQSTGQKSHCVNTELRPSQCYVLIRQSDSPCQRQFLVGSYVVNRSTTYPRGARDKQWSPGRDQAQADRPRSPKHAQPVKTRRDRDLPTSRPEHPTLRANSYPEVSNLFCRLPLPTFFHQLEAVHLGDLLRLWVRPDVRIPRLVRPGHSPGFSRTVSCAPDTAKMRCSTSRKATSPLDAIPWASALAGLSRRGENSPRGNCRRLQVRLTLPL